MRESCSLLLFWHVMNAVSNKDDSDRGRATTLDRELFSQHQLHFSQLIASATEVSVGLQSQHQKIILIEEPDHYGDALQSHHYLAQLAEIQIAPGTAGVANQ